MILVLLPVVVRQTCHRLPKWLTSPRNPAEGAASAAPHNLGNSLSLFLAIEAQCTHARCIYFGK
jgi:hypothetical protein